MKEEWLMPDAVVPVDAETTAALVTEIKRLIDVVGDLALQQALAQPEWIGLTDEDLKPLCVEWRIMYGGYVDDFAKAIEAKLKEKNT